MKRLFLALATTALSGCAGTAAAPTSKTEAEPLACDQIKAELGRAESAKRAALARQKDAWKAVIPFAVAARHASARADASKADQKLHDLQDQYLLQGCGSHS